MFSPTQFATHTPSPPPAAPVHDEFGTTPRTHLSISSDIRRRMARDIATLVGSSADKTVCADDLLRLGWTRQQIDRHAQSAASLVPDLLVRLTPGPDKVQPPMRSYGYATPEGMPMPECAPAPSPDPGLLPVIDRCDAACLRIDGLIAQLQQEANTLRSLGSQVRAHINSHTCGDRP